MRVKRISPNAVIIESLHTLKVKKQIELKQMVYVSSSSNFRQDINDEFNHVLYKWL